MPSVFFKIGASDWTPWEDIQSHDVQREDVYETWTDGNWIDHRVIARTRISGKVKLGFDRAVDFAAFAAQLDSARDAEGFYAITVYCQNTGTMETVNAFLDVSTEAKWDLINGRQWQVATIKITGR